MMVKQWELLGILKTLEIGFLIMLYCYRSLLEPITNGIKPTEVEEFGNYGGLAHVDKGWITHESLVHFKLSDSAVKIDKKKVLKDNIRVKLTPVNSNSDNDTNSLNDESLDLDEIRQHTMNGKWPITEVAVMNNVDYIYKSQNQFGTIYKPEEMMIFQCQVTRIESTAFLVDVYTDSKETSATTHLGYCYIMPDSIKDGSYGNLKLTIVNLKHHPIGSIKVDYLVIHSLPENICDMSVSYAKYWDPSWTGLNVGHRGSGSSFKASFKSCSHIRENTLASLQLAAEHGADYLEFDVHLSKDHIPVVYHDFVVNVLLKKKGFDDHDKLLLPVKELTLDQLQRLKFLHQAESESSKLPDVGDDRPFPTLESVLDCVDERVGMNVELKWNMQKKDGTYELEHPFDPNLYVDQVVMTVLRHAGKRKIVFSCFHPDICVMLRTKQNKYPVLFLTIGVSQRMEPYKDPRTNCIPVSTYFALSCDILGINVHAEDILRDPSQVRFVKNFGLTLFCWGEDNNDQAIIRQMKKLGVDGIIYDKIYEYHVKEKENETTFLA
ncbi:hypothetical protein QYM36_005081 [Artemia franciscana]|uniref:GP-PDE domain-containing protein n=1 Tax=Artemia franciscana TaxID=6661 RepID=A0AA88I6Z7_ARTSF|nr:hypothetical protein QYM36_005081 [Artemia franciscana]KAK2719475.1 hypothetical protein QYM36_005081 [Artemia franciscana]KAK2719476.1 hypothetical protein QYM36_005081 [Artemia franciscana]